MTTTAELVVASSKDKLAHRLAHVIVELFVERSSPESFTIALSGGSLPSMLKHVPQVLKERDVSPQWSSWHVLLADERCVPETQTDSNLGAIRENFLSHTEIPSSQVYGVDIELGSSTAMAKDYQSRVVEPLLEAAKKKDKNSDGQLDCALLGFGPDGHTCSLFPGHELLSTPDDQWVASLDDSPKPPPSRITLTLPLLNTRFRHVVFVGAGSSKQDVVSELFDSVAEAKENSKDDSFSSHKTTLATPAPYPCGMVRPQEGSLLWMVDSEAAKTLKLEGGDDSKKGEL